MIQIDEELNITVSHHDTFSIRFTVDDYVLTENDQFVFGIKASTTSTEVLYEKSFYNSGNSYVDVIIPKGDLDSLVPGTYVYDTAIVNEDTGKIISLFFPKRFIVKGVAHHG